MTSFIELSREATLHMFKTLIVLDCAYVLSALCVIFFKLKSFRYRFYHVWQNIWFAVARVELIVGDDGAREVGPNTRVLKHSFAKFELFFKKGQRLGKRTPLTTKWSILWTRIRHIFTKKLIFLSLSLSNILYMHDFVKLSGTKWKNVQQSLPGL